MLLERDDLLVLVRVEIDRVENGAQRRDLLVRNKRFPPPFRLGSDLTYRFLLTRLFKAITHGEV